MREPQSSSKHIENKVKEKAARDQIVTFIVIKAREEGVAPVYT